MRETRRMRQSFYALVLAVAVVLAGTAFFTGARDEPAQPGDALAAATAGPATIANETLVSFDGTVVHFTVFKPAGATPAQPVPVVFHSHGWSGTRTTTPTGIVGKLVAAGFGVVSVDARGHGATGGVATVHHRDYEVKDSLAVLDWVAANLDWVARENATGIPGDLVAGGTGYSYGGHFQLQLAAHDARIDAIAPEITWHDVAESLAPNGAPKSVWLHALIGMAKQSGTRMDPRIEAWYRQVLLTNTLPADALAHFEGSNAPLANVTADVLLIQGVPDVLFNFNQAARSYHALEAAGAGDVRLFTHLTGHVLPGLQPFALDDGRRATFADDGPCGPVHALILAWLDHKLRGGPAPALAEVSLALEQGECVALDAYPTDALEVRFPALPAPNAAGTLLVPLMQGPAVVAGIPRLEAQVAAPLGGVVHAGLVLVDGQGRSRIVDDQTMGFRLDGATLDVDLSGVATRLDAGDQLFLRLDGLNEWHATNGARTPGGGLLTDVVVTVPLVL